ncbi:MAG: phosphoribosylanthranilate isomerase [Chitinispirillaceae bacterium]
MAVKVKICGITRYEDARIAANLGVDALGFIFYPKSPRFIQPADAREIIARLPPFVSKVGVFVNEAVENINTIIARYGIDTIQLHGDEHPASIDQIQAPVIKSFSVGSDFDLQTLHSYNVSAFLLDTWDGNKRGGTGKTFDWAIARKATSLTRPIILAGGLGPTNIEEALQNVEPYGVDVSSGVEIMPGVKNPHKMRDFIKKVKAFA